MKNTGHRIVSSFGDEWPRFNQDRPAPDEHSFIFVTCFDIFPRHSLPNTAKGFDMGCGSGTWANLLAPKACELKWFAPSTDALAVSQPKLLHLPSVRFINAGVSDQALPKDVKNFGCSLAALNFVRDTVAALRDSVRILEPCKQFHALDVISLAVRLPMGMKIRNGESNRVLMQVLYQYVPRKIIDRPKAVFYVPIGSWFSGLLRERVEDLLSPLRLERERFSNPKGIRHTSVKYLSRKQDGTSQIWGNPMLQTWQGAQLTS